MMSHKKNILILDNDECLGYFGSMSGFYTSIIGNYCYKNRLERQNQKRQEVEKLFREFSVDLLKTGFARPALKEFFNQAYQLKKSGDLDHIVMYTSANRNSGKHEEKYVDWVGMLRSIFEQYAGKPIYDLDHSGRSDENPPLEAKDGATLKSVGRIISRLGLTKDQVGKIMFLDDRPHNIECQENCPTDRTLKLGMTAYMYLPKLERLAKVCQKWDPVFQRAGLEMPSKYLADYYREDAEDLLSEGKKPGGIRKDP